MSPMHGVRWTQETPARAVLRWHWTWPVAHLVGMGWNGAFLVSGLVGATTNLTMGLAGALGCAVFGLFFVRALLVRTTLRFERGVFTVSSTWRGDATLSLAVGDIRSFAARHNSTTNGTDVVVFFGPSDEKVLPIDVDPFNMVWKGTDRKVWVTSPERARLVAARLEEMLEHVRRGDKDTYRA